MQALNEDVTPAQRAVLEYESTLLIKYLKPLLQDFPFYNLSH